MAIYKRLFEICCVGASFFPSLRCKASNAHLNRSWAMGDSSGEMPRGSLDADMPISRLKRMTDTSKKKLTQPP